MARHSEFIRDLSMAEIMEMIANAPKTVKTDIVSAYPLEMTRRRRSTFIPEPTKKRRVIRSDSPVPMSVSSKRTNTYLCNMLQPHSHPSPRWLTHPEEYRCTKCGRYCSDTFLVNSLCGYCRGEY